MDSNCLYSTKIGECLLKVHFDESSKIWPKPEAMNWQNSEQLPTSSGRFVVRFF